MTRFWLDMASYDHDRMNLDPGYDKLWQAMTKDQDSGCSRIRSNWNLPAMNGRTEAWGEWNLHRAGLSEAPNFEANLFLSPPIYKKKCHWKMTFKKKNEAFQIWLVQPLWKTSVNWDDESQYWKIQVMFQITNQELPGVTTKMVAAVMGNAAHYRHCQQPGVTEPDTWALVLGLV